MFSTFHLNIRSLSKNYDMFCHFLFSAIAFSETWLTSESAFLYDIPNYHGLHYYRMARAGGGVSIYLHNQFQYNYRNELTVSTHDNDVESLFIEIFSCDTFDGKGFIIGCIYRPPDTDIKKFISSLAFVLDKINHEGKVCFLLGDFNINLFNNESQPLTADFLNILYANSLFPLITKPTRVTPSSATLIDNIFTNSLNNVLMSGLFYSDISDRLNHLIMIIFKKKNRK